MALKSTIYKFELAVSDLDRNYYDTLSLTVAQHPSESVERMMVRLLAYCLNADEGIEFSKGLSDAYEPDLWSLAPDRRILLWVDVGEPAIERIRKAARLADAVRVYSFNSKSNAWWRQAGPSLKALTKVEVFQFPWADIQTLARLVRRTMRASITISGSSAYIAAERGEYEVSWSMLESP